MAAPERNIDPPHAPRRRPARSSSSVRLTGLFYLVACLALNWFLAARWPSSWYSCSSLAIFIALMILIARMHPRAAILLAPVAITRFATMLSFLAIEAGAYMPEINRAGTAGDASASFVVFTAIYFLSFTAIFAAIERPLTAHARSQLVDTAVALLAWPIVLLCGGWCLVALAHGITNGFPLLEGLDRFTYRRYHGSFVLLVLLENKFLFATLLGAVVFSAKRPRLLRTAAGATFMALTGTYFLFGDKFFTILAEIAFFLCPYLLQNHRKLVSTLVRLTPLVAIAIAVTSATTLYIYSDYGRLPTDRAMKKLGDRISEQGEIWYVATRDYRQTTHWDAALVARYLYTLRDTPTPTVAMHQGVETYFFIQRYAPPKFAAAFRRAGGWVQETMGTEAMALVMFGYVGVALTMLAAGIATAVVACYLERALLSGFPLSMVFAVWAYLQVYVAVQQASLSMVAEPGQLKRFLLFFVIELVLFAINRVTPRRGPRPILAQAAS